MKILKSAIHKYNSVTQFVENNSASITKLAIRLLVANVFFVSGWLKFGYLLNDQLDTLYFLFEDYNVPFLSVKVAAIMGMMGELGLSILLAAGLFSRIAALGLIFMSGVIYHVDQNVLAPYWALLLAVIFTQGAGRISLDHIIKKLCRKYC